MKKRFLIGWIIVAPASVAWPQAPGALPESASTSGYPSPAAALEALRARSDVEFTEAEGWTVVIDRPNMAQWSFSPNDHPTYPAVVKRTFVVEGDNLSVRMQVMCGGTKIACDQLVLDYRKIDQDAAASRRQRNEAKR